MLKEIKLSALHAADALGASELVLNSSWRSQRLLILGYHGVSLEDEHEWEPSLFMPASFLRRRFELLEKEKCQVLPFDTAVRALYVGELPPRSVAITFDDGTHDFYCRALPILTEFGYPATLYLTTYYSYFNRPVFDPAVRYILWKARGRMLKFPEALPGPILLHGAGREAAYRAIAAYALKDDLGGSDKDALLERLACAAEVDYGAI